MKVILWFGRYRSVLLNLLFVCYIAFLQPGLLGRLQATRGYSVADPLIGGLLLGLPLAELAGIRLKLPVFAYAFQGRFPSDSHLFRNARLQVLAIAFCFFSMLFGMPLSAVFVFIALEMLGIARSPVLCLAGFPAMMLRAWVAAMLWYGASLGEIRMKAPKQVGTGLVLRDLLGDALLLVYSAVGYTVLWEASPFFSQSVWGDFFFGSFFPGTTWGDDLFALLYFLCIYTVLRSIYLVQDVFLETSRTVRLWSLLGHVSVLVMAMLSVPQR